MTGRARRQAGGLAALGRIGRGYFRTFLISPDGMVEEDGTVVVPSHVEARTRSGNEVKLPSVEIRRMSDGKSQRGQSLADTAEMKKALES